MADKGEKSGFGMQEVARNEYGFFWQQQRSLIRCNHSLSEDEVRVTVEVARAHLLPVSALGLVPSKNGLRPCITKEGLLWRLHNDQKGLQGIESEVIQWASEENGFVAKAKCTVNIGGSTFVDYAQHSRAGEVDPDITADEITQKCIDGARHRAGKIACGVALPSYEELLEEEEEA